ncbi:MAG: Ig-like domain-containing protein [Patescibacteria group bacterium]|jgi:hypothetical protein
MLLFRAVIIVIPMNIRKSIAGIFSLMLVGSGVAALPSAAFAVSVTTVSGAVMRDADHNGRLDHIDVTFSGPIDATSLAASDFSTASCTFFTPAFPVTAAASTGPDSVSLSITEESVIYMDTGVTCNVLVNGVLDTSGSSADGSVTATDGAGPVIRSIEYTDDNWNGKIDHLIVRYSEALSDGAFFSVSSFEIANAGDFTGTTVAAVGPDGISGNLEIGVDMKWVSVLLSEGSAIDTHDDSGAFALATTPTYSASDVFLNPDLNVGAQPQASVVDLAKPLMKSLTYLDGDADGMIDSLDLELTETVSASSSSLAPNSLMIVGNGGFAGVSFGNDSTDLITVDSSTIRLPLVESSVVSTGAGSAFSIADVTDGPDFLLTDSSGNQSRAYQQFYATLEVFDGAAPVLVSSTPADGGNLANLSSDLALTFSEDISTDSIASSSVSLQEQSSIVGGFGPVVTLNPDTDLLINNTYHIQIGAAMRRGVVLDMTDLRGNRTARRTITFTTNQSSGGSRGGSGYIAPNLPGIDPAPAAVITPVAPPAQVLGTTDSALVDGNGVMAGDYIRGTSWSTVYYVSADMVRHVLIDEQTYFTYQDSWDVVKTLPDEALANYPMGSLVLPKAGTVLVKIQSATEVYALENDASGNTILREVPNEMTAEYVFGTHWADYVIDVSPAFYKKFTLGKEIDTAFPVNMTNMKTRSALNSH